MQRHAAALLNGARSRRHLEAADRATRVTSPAEFSQPTGGGRGQHDGSLAEGCRAGDVSSCCRSGPECCGRLQPAALVGVAQRFVAVTGGGLGDGAGEVVADGSFGEVQLGSDVRDGGGGAGRDEHVSFS